VGVGSPKALLDISEGKKWEKKFDDVSNWNAHQSGRPFHFSMGILFYKNIPK
jgi:uncharacterized protein YegJ (DUF2314 family)